VGCVDGASVYRKVGAKDGIQDFVVGEADGALVLILGKSEGTLVYIVGKRVGTLVFVTGTRDGAPDLIVGTRVGTTKFADGRRDGAPDLIVGTRVGTTKFADGRRDGAPDLIVGTRDGAPMIATGVRDGTSVEMGSTDGDMTDVQLTAMHSSSCNALLAEYVSLDKELASSFVAMCRFSTASLQASLPQQYGSPTKLKLLIESSKRSPVSQAQCASSSRVDIQPSTQLRSG
jgi:hypothetical protein